MRGRARASALALLLAIARTADAQPAVTSLIEAQAGNVPFIEPTNRTDLYGQFQLEYGFTSVDERFVELHVAPENARVWEATAFWDEGKDLSSSISDRRVFGAGGTVRFRERWSVGVDLERQDATRRFATLPSASFNDQYASLTVSRAKRPATRFSPSRAPS